MPRQSSPSPIWSLGSGKYFNTKINICIWGLEGLYTAQYLRWSIVKTLECTSNSQALQTQSHLTCLTIHSMNVLCYQSRGICQLRGLMWSKCIEAIPAEDRTQIAGVTMIDNPPGVFPALWQLVLGQNIPALLACSTYLADSLTCSQKVSHSWMRLGATACLRSVSDVLLRTLVHAGYCMFASCDLYTQRLHDLFSACLMFWISDVMPRSTFDERNWY
jgi:hypothetical protein